MRAHTVPRKGALSQIARKGHVYQVLPSSVFESAPSLIGVKNATTFRGFCKHHDDIAFTPIEKQAFVGTPHQNQLVGYRAICFAFHRKYAAADVAADFSRRLRALPNELQRQEIQNLLRILTGYQEGASCLKILKNRYGEVLRERSWSDIKTCVILLDTTPEVQCTGAFAPDIDFSDRTIQNRWDDELDWITFSIFGVGNTGAVVLTWIDNPAGPSQTFIASLIEDTSDQAGNAFVRVALEELDNVCFSPSWWEALADSDRESLLRRLPAGHDGGLTEHTLSDDGIRAVNWEIKEIIMDT